MLFELIGDFRVQAGTNGANVEHPLTVRAGGRMARNSQFWVLVTAFGGVPNIGFKITDGPNGVNFLTHTNVDSGALGTTLLWVFDSSATARMLGEFVRGVVVAGGTATGDWMQVKVWELRKPF